MEMSSEIMRLAKAKDIDGLYELVKDEFVAHTPSTIKSHLEDFAGDIVGATGVVCVTNSDYQDLIMYFLELSR